jgi:hypothetical protein
VEDAGLRAVARDEDSVTISMELNETVLGEQVGLGVPATDRVAPEEPKTRESAGVTAVDGGCGNEATPGSPSLRPRRLAYVIRAEVAGEQHAVGVRHRPTVLASADEERGFPPLSPAPGSPL